MPRPSSLTASLRRLPHLGRGLALAAFGVLVAGPALELSVTSAFAQGVVSAGLTGLVTGTDGQPVAAAAVKAVHQPTGTTYTAVTGATGRYNFRGLIVGGPYMVSIQIPGQPAVERTGITTQLGESITENFDFAAKPTAPASADEVVAMEAFHVEGDASALDPNASGAGSVLTSARLALQPTAQRSFQDMARTNPLVTFRASVTDRLEQQITAVGQNNRFNSILLDGARINDQFGLNGSGLQSFFNPISIETVEQISVSVSPYDARQSGFTGAAINAVTKSGTNTFSGSIYGYYSDEDFAGKDEFGASAGTRPYDKQQTWGATFGGPILPNRVFFFLNYEKFERETAASQPGFVPDSAQLATIQTRLAQITGFDLGTYGGPSALLTEDEKRLAKIDWNITSAHRLSVRYNDTKGTLPQFGRFSTTTTFNGLAGLSAPRGTALSSNFYTQARTEEVWAGSLQSQWTPDFKTEFKYTNTSYEQLTTTPEIFPEIRIFGVSGVAPTGNITNGVLVLGSEQFRHGNLVQVDTESYSGHADYFLGDLTLSGGFDYEKSDFYNLFRQGSYGLFDYASIAAFTADTPQAFVRSFYVNGTAAADLSNFANTGLYAQAKWDVSPRLNFTAGLRYDFVDSSTRPLFNQAFATAFGLRNDGTVDGAESWSPRVAFNWAVTEERDLQFRGGIGHFQGRAPWVFVSNAFGNTGVGRFNSTTTPTGGLTGYLASAFDPENPIGVAATDGQPGARREVNLLEDELSLPAVWRANLGLDRKLPFLGSLLALEVVHTDNTDALFTDNLNIKPSGAVAADGRIRYAGSATSSGAFSTAFGNVIRVRNVSEGSSTYFTAMIDRPLQDRWSFNLSYTRGHSTEAQAFGQTVAVDGWSRNAVFNQNTVEVARSDFEVKNRVQLTLTKQVEWAKGWTTTGSLYYEGRTGNPYSFVYTATTTAANDLNNDGVQGNDLVYVPTGPTDPVMDFSGLTASQLTAFFGFLDSSGLSRYAGTYAPRNSFTQPWVNRLDLRLAQRIPIYQPAELELFFDFINFGSLISEGTFGYVEELGNNGGVFARRFLGAASYTTDGRIRQLYTGTPADATISNLASRWRIQFGARLKF